MSYWDYFVEILAVVGFFAGVAIWAGSIIWALGSLLIDYSMWWLWRGLAGVYAFFALVAGLALLASLPLD